MSKKNHPYHRAYHLIRLMNELDDAIDYVPAEILKGFEREAFNELKCIPSHIVKAAQDSINSLKKQDRYWSFTWIRNLWASSKHQHWFFIRNEQHGHGYRFIAKFRFIQFQLGKDDIPF